MAPLVKVFRAVGALVVGVKTLTEVTVGALTDVGGQDDVTKIKRFDVDLAKSPLKGPWTTIECDDCGVDRYGKPVASTTPWDYPLMITSIGTAQTTTPMQFVSLGGLYLEDGKFTPLGLTNWPPTGSGYVLQQMTTLAYKAAQTGEPRSGHRYHGFIGKVTAKNGTVLSMTIEGTAVDVDYTNPARCDGGPPASVGAPAGIVTLPSTAKLGDTLLIFLELAFAVGAGLSGPKMPIGLN